ncbi:hypothetical protein [Cellulomonas sp. RIT-PI-Y]|uniref:hypothetical protein n=1 Tax=Cellulomonas sp. RIT-PI-Y TaxID=3035297 RepID=UPI0021D9A218|nr:hypothetical protein [Cellulomonas sp. RIT-PI-Y]
MSLTTLIPPSSPAAARDDGLFRPGDLDPIAWQILVHEGALRVVAPGVAMPVRRRPTPRHRAAALAGVLPRGWLFGGATAYWLHVGGPGPTALALISPPGTHPPQGLPGRVMHQQVLPARDRAEVDGVAVTTPLRTAVDLACFTAPASAVPRLLRLSEQGVDLRAALNRLAGLGRQRGVLRGDRTLREALSRLR